MPVEINIKGFDELQQRLGSAAPRLNAKVGAVIQAGANDIAGIAKINAPADIGFLRNQIGSSQVDQLHAEVFSGASYSAYVEFGTRTYVSVPAEFSEYASQYIGSAGSSELGAKDAIFEWCRRKGIDKNAWWAIFISIMTKGIKPQPYFFPAVNQGTAQILSDVKDVVDEVV